MFIIYFTVTKLLLSIHCIGYISCEVLANSMYFELKYFVMTFLLKVMVYFGPVGWMGPIGSLLLIVSSWLLLSSFSRKQLRISLIFGMEVRCLMVWKRTWWFFQKKFNPQDFGKIRSKFDQKLTFLDFSQIWL